MYPFSPRGGDCHEDDIHPFSPRSFLTGSSPYPPRGGQDLPPVTKQDVQRSQNNLKQIGLAFHNYDIRLPATSPSNIGTRTARRSSAGAWRSCRTSRRTNCTVSSSSMSRGTGKQQEADREDAQDVRADPREGQGGRNLLPDLLRRKGAVRRQGEEPQDRKHRRRHLEYRPWSSRPASPSSGPIPRTCPSTRRNRCRNSAGSSTGSATS